MKETIIKITHKGGDVKFEWKKLLELITFSNTFNLSYSVEDREIKEEKR